MSEQVTFRLDSRGHRIYTRGEDRRLCEAENCDRAAVARGLCDKHWQRMVRKKEKEAKSEQTTLPHAHPWVKRRDETWADTIERVIVEATAGERQRCAAIVRNHAAGLRGFPTETALSVLAGVGEEIERDAM